MYAALFYSRVIFELKMQLNEFCFPLWKNLWLYHVEEY